MGKETNAPFPGYFSAAILAQVQARHDMKRSRSRSPHSEKVKVSKRELRAIFGDSDSDFQSSEDDETHSRSSGIPPHGSFSSLARGGDFRSVAKVEVPPNLEQPDQDLAEVACATSLHTSVPIVAPLERPPSPALTSARKPTGVNGLSVVPGFLSDSLQKYLLQNIASSGWLADPQLNQAISFGTLPTWLDGVIAAICKTGIFSEALSARRPGFDHMLLNVYQPGEGLGKHVDLLRFEDGICSLSLESPCIMTFTHVTTEAIRQVLLEPGDLLCMEGEARYDWMHGIDPCMQEEWKGATINRGRRISITLRRLCAEGWVVGV
ncbi:hypothetical protein CYMTET_5130 [Cymbomonas tetramitiformis]|uniref:Fe2OG dioxygenase domain-containing protein n=1 Tax=Cymbomonas tetramitiformis TaxID=36881 RepID=A0AAE0GZZ3_9CHLO|nr:hypothetical protein CYMTET_5130 [Cymbomonas tetramitiformis]